MASKFIEQRVTTMGTTRVVSFAGDRVQLAGQVNYPKNPAPAQGYPLIFIIQHATCNTREGYSHIAALGARNGFAVFSWDKRGTGESASGGGAGSLLIDTLNAYETALYEPHINCNNVIIFAQSEGTLLLGENYPDFCAIQKPKGVVLAGNMMDERQILALDVPLRIVMSKNDWNDWHIYAEKALTTYNRVRKMNCEYYVAPNTDRRLMYSGGNTFDTGAAKHIENWLHEICPDSASV